MRKFLVFFLYLGMFCMAIDINGTMEVKSRRISKGKVSNPDPVALYEIEISQNGFYGKIFAIEDLTNFNKGKDIDRYEIERYEFSLGYKYDFKDLDYIKSLKIDLGYKNTSFQGDMCGKHDTENEIYFKFTTGLFLKPGMKFVYDEKNNAFYSNLFASYDYEFNDNMKLKNKADFYLMNGYYNEYANGFHNAAFTALYIQHYLEMKTQYKNFTWGPVLEYSWALDHRVRDSWKSSSKNNSFNVLVGIKFDLKF